MVRLLSWQRDGQRRTNASHFTETLNPLPSLSSPRTPTVTSRWAFSALGEEMARVISEKLWTSEKIRNIQPKEWQPEYAWLYPIALVDGTFECQPRLIWAQAYACNREEWSPEKVAQLLDELERVGLLQRSTAEDGKVWGRWAGSEKFSPTKEHIESHRYKTGRPDLFPNAPLRSSASAAPALPQRSTGQSRLGVGVGSGIGIGKEVGVGSAAKDSENGKTNPKNGGAFSSTPTPTPQKQRQRQVLSRDEYAHEQGRPADEARLASMKAEIEARPPCPGCGGRHPEPSPDCKLAETTRRR
jgi:hypothetical protein